MALFYLGGQVSAEEMLIADMSQPKFTDIVLFWAYALLAITIVVLLSFAIVDFLKKLKESPRKALSGFLVLLGMAAMLIITFVIGDDSLLNIPGYDGADNNPSTLKMTDMWLFSAYIMLIITFLAIVILPLFKRKS
jgi:heme/copper-type cytochrome/quinol oxidase subunit 2